MPLDWSLSVSIAVFAAAALVIGLTGVRLARYADRLADITGLGEAVTGTLFLGLVTSLPGVAASVAAALEGLPALAISNAMGGIAVQTTFLAVADLVYRKANLEHAAASLANMLQTVILMLLLVLVLLALTGPALPAMPVHPVTPLLFVAVGGGLWLVYRSAETPMWRPQWTRETVPDRPERGPQGETLTGLLTGFAVAAVLVLLAGAAVAHAAGRIVALTGVSESLMGGLFTAAVTSLPELVTTVAAVRRGALTLAVSDIVGGNMFDVLFVCFADLAYLGGSIYHAPDVGAREVFITGLAILLNGILLMGLLYRERHGVVNIGFESALMLLGYLGGMAVLGWAM